jgi:uncharacterized protein (TIGR02145 family)
MKSINRFYVFILATCLLINAFAINKINAQPVDTVQGKLVAKNFFTDRLSRTRLMYVKGISSQNIEMFLIHEEKENISKPGDLKKGSQTLPLYYIYNVKDKFNSKDKNGFVIVSADQRISSILGYSFTGEFSENDQAPAFKAWMEHYKEQIIYVIQNNLTPGSKISDEWKKYSGTSELKGTEQLSEVLPLLTTKWSQRGYYNNLCPADISCTGSLNGHVPAGCAAVAMAQIMRYHEYPASNNPIPGYTSTNYGWQPDVGITSYDWSQMPVNIDKANPISPTSAEIDAVSKIIYHCGVALQMNYGPDGSGAGSPINAFKDYFKYSPDIQDIDKSGYSDDEWRNIMRNELDNNRPVYYAGYKDEMYGGGHAFVCDGYQNTDYFHFNWGLGGGGGDGYFYLNDLTPGSYNYNFKQWANIGISPDQNLAIADIDGNSYNIVTVGTQKWMDKNLKTTKYNDGTAIAYPGTNNNAWQTNTSGAYAWWGNNEANKNTYGALYNWYAVNSGNLCPAGWHVPSFNDWLDLMTFLGDGDEFNGRLIGGGLLKEIGITHWKPSNEGASDAYGFTALPGGNRSSDGNFFNIENLGAWWASGYWWNDATKTFGTGFDIFSSSAGVSYGASEKEVGLSVRCLKGPLVETIHVDAGSLTDDNIGTAGQEKWYRFQTGLAGTYAIQTYGSTDTYMYLYNSDQTTIIAEDNDGAGSGHNSKIVRSLSANTWYYVKIKGNNNVTGSFSIGVSALPAQPTASNLTVTYDGLWHTASAWVPSGISIVWYNAVSEGSEATQPTGKDYGTYIAYAEAKNDVTGCTSALRTPVSLTINRRLATWRTNASHKTYGDMDPIPLTIGTGTNLIEADGITATYNRISGETVGAYHITATLIPASAVNNYTITNAGATFTIDKKDASVTPYAASKYCGQTDPVFTGTLTGFLSSDEVSATYSRTVGETVNGSPYAISATLNPANVLTNYKIAYYSANFTIMSVSIDASQSSIPLPVGSPSMTLSAKVLNVNLIPVPGVKVWFSVENGNNLIINYPAVLTDGFGVATITLNGLTSMVDVFKVTAVAGSGCGNAATSIAYLAVYDPSGGFVTGGGWINSPDGALVGTHLTGKANFGFVSKYKKGSNIPDGNTEFQFHEGNLDFNSASNESGSLVIAGYKAIFKGAGTINGTGNYVFMVSAVDGDASGGGGYDKFRIKIWNKTDKAIVYDNNLGRDENDVPLTALGGGSIVIHKANDNTPKSNQMDESGLKVYPNPFTDHIYFDLQLKTDSKVSLEIFDISGTKLATVFNDVVVAFDHYLFEYNPKNVSSGIFFYRLIVDGQMMFTGNLIHY